MEKFPENIQFCFPWRPYQARVLGELDSHLSDDHLNIVAAPGSGKTILGLEVMLRIGKPTLILAPTIAIRNQWIDRFTENFLQVEEVPNWISKSIKEPKFITVSTYQGLHAAMREEVDEDDDEELSDDEVEELIDEDVENNSPNRAEELLSKLKAQNINTLIIDEAHHLRNEWWNSLIKLKDSIADPQIVALTATPPYDVDPKEWKNYQNLCGPIDAEISVPELVKEKNLCPHQDYVYLSKLSKEEDKQVDKFRERAKEMVQSLKENQELILILQNHPCILDPDTNVQTILRNAEYYSTIVMFLNSVNAQISNKFFNSIGVSRWRFPKLSEERLETMLENLLYRDKYMTTVHKDFLDGLRKELKQNNVLEKRTVSLRDNSQVKRLLKESLGKLDSILKIIELEHRSLGSELRLVILTDYIRSEFMPEEEGVKSKLTKLGVVPIFEKIRNEYKGTNKIGILSGRLVVIPKSAEKTLRAIASELEIPDSDIVTRALRHDNNYLEVKIKGASNQNIVYLITKTFGEGEIEVLVGTKSLLGEGWDFPELNTLILASFVGSYMFSNQMRGRAIRIDPKKPDKVANIWHLATVKEGGNNFGYDFSTLERRFNSFVGVSVEKDEIENGFNRMQISTSSLNEKTIPKVNDRTSNLATDRIGVREKWNNALDKGKMNMVVPEIQTEEKALPRKFVLYNTIFALAWRSVVFGGYFFLNAFLEFASAITEISFENLNFLLCGTGVIMSFAFIVTLPGLIKALWLFLRNGPVDGNMRQIGITLLRTLNEIGIIKSNIGDLNVVTEKSKDGTVSCRLDGATSYEKSVFFDCLEEILDPVESPRYLLIRRSKLNFWLREDYHTVPSLIGANKKYALIFSQKWSKYVGDNKLIYTRSIPGRKILLKARSKSLASGFQDRSKRVEVWK